MTFESEAVGVRQAAAFTQSLFDCRDTSFVGGKAVNLGRLLRAGFPVPGGFTVTTAAYRAARAGGPSDMPDDIADSILAAYRAMGGGTVAVRSSATAEDTAAASMAGQYETFLDIEGEANLLDAVARCWASLDTLRTRAYLREHNIDPAAVAMAVIVQALVPADVAGVLFTVNPNEGSSREMLVEASWGLGESVVSGRVQPDVLRLDAETGRVIAATIADKRVELLVGVGEERAVDDARRHKACLRSRDVHELWQLGRRVANHFGSPQDIEWGIHGDQVYLLQSRPITTHHGAAAREEVLQTTRENLRKGLASGRGPWVLHNLAETLAHPTPLTWSVIGRFMSGAGGFGAMYRQAGFEPSPAMNREGFLELIAGRVYMDASRASEMFFEGFPFAYDVGALKRTPDASQVPPTIPNGSLLARLKAGRELAAVGATLATLAVDFDRKLREAILPAFAREVAEAKRIVLSQQLDEQLIDLWQQREASAMDRFAPQSLLPSLIGGMALGELREFLREHFWDEDADALAQLISAGGPPNRTVIADAELFEVARGQRPLDSWLEAHGHRAVGEFDLASPRWRERPDAVRELAGRLKSGEGPLARHEAHVEAINARVAVLRLKLDNRDADEFDRRIALVRRYVAFREDGKDALMLGYDLLRDVALEAGRRLEIGDDVFFLTREDLFAALRVGFAPLQVILQRKIAHRAAAGIPLPHVIDTVEGLGEAAPLPESTHGHKAFAVSSGEATGPVRVLHSPTGAPDLGCGYVLICPSTDPSWTPLFVNAAALVLKCGGTLSHGAVVAREMGLPAVVLPDATRLFADGQTLHVDGRRGWVGPRTEAEARPEGVDAQDDRIAPELLPPPPGRTDRVAAKLRNRFAATWAMFLLGFFCLPETWVRQPSMRGMDALLWPLARSLGKPTTVAVVAVGVAVATLLIQRFLTDNARLLEAKRRAARLKAQADSLPPESPRRRAMVQAAAPVQFRVLMAALVPVGMLLGPMVMPFVWFKERVDPAAQNAAAGSPVRIVAEVDSNWSGPVQLRVPAPMALDETTPASRTLPPIRQTLQTLLALYRRPSPRQDEPWQLALAPDLGRELTANDLQAYLDAGVPPQAITWLVRPPANFNGRFTVTASTSAASSVNIPVVIGDRFPPSLATFAEPANGPIKELKAVYAPAAQRAMFWRPFAWIHFKWSSRLAAFDAGWIGLYVLAYLPALFITKAALRVA